MIRHSLLAFVSLPVLGACAATTAAAAPPEARFLAARLLADAAVADPPPARPSRVARRVLTLARRAPDRAAPAARLQASGRSAIREPRTDGYVGSVQVYPWTEGAVYRLYTAPEQVSDIALQPGESLVSVAAGDTARWVIGDTASGSGPGRRTHVLVKPSAAGLRTNLVIATDRRVYHVQVASTPAAAMASIAWTYPEDGLVALRGRTAAAEQPVAAGVAVDTLNFNYRIDGDRPPWRPVRAFDDGRQVFIEFPPLIGAGEAPPLFVTGEGGRAELVNYRMRGRYYVVDRLFAAAELRLGERRQQVVRIVRQGGVGS